MGGLEPGRIVLQLGNDDALLDKAAPGPKHQTALLEVLAPEQAFDKERHVGMVLDDFLIIVLQAALDVQQLGGMMAAQRVLPIPGRQFLQLFAHELQGRNALSELAKEVAEV